MDFKALENSFAVALAIASATRSYCIDHFLTIVSSGFFPSFSHSLISSSAFTMGVEYLKIRVSSRGSMPLLLMAPLGYLTLFSAIGC
ncbi:MAG: hypothetical protein ABSF82_06790 [Candidatus Bathyarchaeia archaeon]